MLDRTRSDRSTGDRPTGDPPDRAPARAAKTPRVYRSTGYPSLTQSVPKSFGRMSTRTRLRPQVLQRDVGRAQVGAVVERAAAAVDDERRRLGQGLRPRDEFAGHRGESSRARGAPPRGRAPRGTSPAAPCRRRSACQRAGKLLDEIRRRHDVGRPRGREAESSFTPESQPAATQRQHARAPAPARPTFIESSGAFCTSPSAMRDARGTAPSRDEQPPSASTGRDNRSLRAVQAVEPFSRQAARVRSACATPALLQHVLHRLRQEQVVATPSITTSFSPQRNGQSSMCSGKSGLRTSTPGTTPPGMNEKSARVLP